MVLFEPCISGSSVIATSLHQTDKVAALSLPIQGTSMTSQSAAFGKASAVATLLVLSSLSAPLGAQAPAALDTEESKLLYALGLSLAQNLDTFNLSYR